MEQISPEVKMEMDLSSAMVEKIESILERKGMTHRELANKIGCDESQIIRWTRGFPNFTFNAIARISCAIGEPLIDVHTIMLRTSRTVLGYYPKTHSQNYLNDSDNMAQYGKDK